MSLPRTASERRALFSQLAGIQAMIFAVAIILGAYGAFTGSRIAVIASVAVIALSLVIAPVMTAIPISNSRKKQRGDSNADS